MHFHIIATLLAATSSLSIAAPVAEAEAPAAVGKRGYTTLFCGGLCVPFIEDPPLYAVCIAACVANGGEGFDPNAFNATIAAAIPAKSE